MRNNNIKLRLRYCGFTLIELLVILSMIMFLVSLLVPALNQVKQTSMRTTCANNLRQISYMATLYTADNNGYVLPCRFKNIDLNHPLRPYDWDFWPTMLAINYLKDHKPKDGYHEILRCPAEDSSGKLWNNYGINTQSRRRNGVSAAPAARPSHWAGGNFQKITRFKKPSETVFIMDWFSLVMFEWGSVNAPTVALAVDRHKTGLNAAFLDGHVNFLDIDDIPANTWTETFWSGL